MVMFVACGVGGAEALQVVRSEMGYGRIIATTEYASKKIKRVEKKTIKEVEQEIREIKPKVVITERSNHIEDQKRITKVCKEEGVVNIVILDIYIPWGKGYKHLFDELPEYVTALSDGSYKELIDTGFKTEQILKVGNPAYIRLNGLEKKEINTKTPRILYTSQGGEGNLSNKETDEIFYSFVKEIEKGYREYSIDIKKHPMETGDRWLSRIKGNKTKVLDIDTRVDFLEYIIGYDLIIGKDSTLQIQAQQIGIPVIYYNEEIVKYIKKFKAGETEMMYKEGLRYYKPDINKIIETIRSV